MPLRTEYFGYNAPFFGGHQNVLSRQSGERIIKNDLMQLILTSTGERIMRPDFGTIVKKSLFEMMTDEKLEEIRLDVDTAILRWEPRIKARCVAKKSPDENLLVLHIIGTYTDKPNEVFEAEINLPLETGVER